MTEVECVDNPSDLFDLGNALYDRGEVVAAIAAFQRCLVLAPDRAAASYNLGNALRQCGRPVEAIDAYLHCLRIIPDFAAGYISLADALRHVGMLEQAQIMAELAVQHAPDLPEATICLASVLHDSSDYEAAAALYRQALARVPGHAGALSNLGNTLHAMGRLPEALAAHDAALAVAPEEPHFHLNRAASRLAAGDFARGWDEYEWRWQDPRIKSRNFGEAWQGEDIAGRTILLHAEQGLGDTLQFVRYAPMVAALGCHVVLEVQPPLARLMRSLQCSAAVVVRGDPLPPFDTHCPLLSLPRIFGTRLETIPADVPYLRAEPAAASAWSVKMPDDGGLRVGLVWAGLPAGDGSGAHPYDRRRSFSLAEYAPLGDVPGVRLVSLQKRDLQQTWAVPAGLTLIDPMADVADFADTAAIIANLDLVITVDTSVAHLAGGMGRRVWLLSRYDGCWRWLQDRDDSPWYPGMRIYRQPRPHDWPAVIARVRRDLLTFRARRKAACAA